MLSNNINNVEIRINYLTLPQITITTSQIITITSQIILQRISILTQYKIQI